MEELQYIVDDSTIVELLGIQNFTSAESAILELVKNAYDAKALTLYLNFKEDELEIIDDGFGMNEDDIKQHWMHIGKSDKKYEVVDEKNNKRIQAGSKGVGRFALSRLGKEIELYSKRDGFDAVVWKTDWSKATVEKCEGVCVRGTKIKIGGLREKWSKKRLDNLCKYLEVTYHDDSMEMYVSYDNEKHLIPAHFNVARPGINCKSSIVLEYENGVLNTHILSDEFKDEAEKYCKGINVHKFDVSTNVNAEIRHSDIGVLLGEELQDKLKRLGRFEANFYFNVVTSLADGEKFLYKSTTTPESIEYGIILYRNAFSISSYDGKKDWLGLGRRSRKSPAAASHPTGSWRIRENQLAGFVSIDKLENANLQDLANRQGLDENEYYQLFVEIILLGITEFERYRQLIIRNVNAKNNVDDESKKTPVIDKVVKAPLSIKTLSDEEAKQLAKEIKVTKKDEKESKKSREETEARYKYDVRILNVLATTGLKASSIAHEMKNDLSTVSGWYEKIINALKDYGMWEELTSDENTQVAFRNVPQLLEDNQEVSKKIIVFMKTMLEEIEKKQFEFYSQNIYERVKKIKDIWERDYAWANIALDIDQAIEFRISEDILQVIFDNLILNSVQQNEKKKHINIIIKAIKQGDLIQFDYYDDGVGLDEKYESNPFKILEVHETTRKNGHGLGMWIVNNTIVMSGGEIQNINGDNGFHIQFTIGGKM